MDEAAWVGSFEASRPRLRSLAHRMLGSRAEADDVVQDVWLRLARTDRGRVDDLAAFLTTVTARLCLDRLRSRRRHPEDLDPPGERAGADRDPADLVATADSVGAALLVVLDALGPAERVAFVLHDVFALPFDDVAAVLDRSPAAARQLASRARRRVQGAGAAAGGADPVRHRQVVTAFLRAAQGGDLEGLLRVLAPDVVLRPDAAAVGMGSLRETRGAAAVAQVLAGGARAARLALVGGLTGLAWAPQGRIRGVIEFTLVDGRIASIAVTGDPARVDALDVVLDDG